MQLRRITKMNMEHPTVRQIQIQCNSIKAVFKDLNLRVKVNRRMLEAMEVCQVHIRMQALNNGQVLEVFKALLLPHNRVVLIKEVKGLVEVGAHQMQAAHQVGLEEIVDR